MNKFMGTSQRQPAEAEHFIDLQLGKLFEVLFNTLSCHASRGESIPYIDLH